MSCVTIKTCVKPCEAMVWAFMVIRRLWPDACGCDSDGDPWSGLQRAYTKQPYRVFENVQALSSHITGSVLPVLDVSWEDKLVVCGEQQMLERLTKLPQWQHLVSAYDADRKPDVRPVDPVVDPIIEPSLEQPEDQQEALEQPVDNHESLEQMPAEPSDVRAVRQVARDYHPTDQLESASGA